MIHRLLCCLLSLSLVSGCSFLHDPSWAPSSINELIPLAILESDATPEIYTPSPVKDYKSGIAQGAVTGMFAVNSEPDDNSQTANPTYSDQESDSSCTNTDGFGSYIGCVVIAGVVGAIISLATTVAAGVVGALWGAGTTAAGYGPQPPQTVADLESIHTAIEHHALQARIADQIKTSVLAERQIPTVIIPYREREAPTTERLFQDKGSLKTLFLVRIDSVSFRPSPHDSNTHYAMYMGMTSKTFRRGEKAPANIHQYEWGGPAYTLEDWGAQEGSRIQEGLRHGVTALGEQALVRLGE